MINQGMLHLKLHDRIKTNISIPNSERHYVLTAINVGLQPPFIFFGGGDVTSVTRHLLINLIQL